MKSDKKTKQSRLAAALRDANILFVDVECTPNLAWIWGKYEQNALGDFVKERQIISFAYKWLGEKDIKVFSLPRFKGYKRNPEDNKALILELYKLYMKAAIVVAHNGDQFDDKRICTEFVLHGLRPPPPRKTFDTLKALRSVFDFNSNKLDDICARLKLGRKVRHPGFSLWVRCMRGDKKAWALMEKYNKGDVVLLERLYLLVRSWARTHPDVNAIDRHIGCPRCKGTNLQRRGWARVGAGRRKRYQCNDCGAWPKGSVVALEERYV